MRTASNSEIMRMSHQRSHLCVQRWLGTIPPSLLSIATVAEDRKVAGHEEPMVPD